MVRRIQTSYKSTTNNRFNLIPNYGNVNNVGGC